jgi:RHS repeat-associated protein
MLKHNLYYTPDVVSHSDYLPFGQVMPNRHGNDETYKYGFNGMEKDDEVKGDGNSYTAQFWEYDTRLGRRWNRDPKPNPSISEYACFANNPILFSDPEGDTIRIPNKGDRKAVLKMINHLSVEQYTTDKKGNLKVVEGKTNKKGSQYYSDMLSLGIKDDDLISIEISTKDKVVQPVYDKNGEIDKTPIGKTKTVDMSDSGEGVTFGGSGKDQLVLISGKGHDGRAKDLNGKNIKYEAGDVLLHELVGHAIPHVLGTKGTGSAIGNENKARKELGKPLRKEENGHAK